MLCQARGYSQQKLADIANVEQSTIKRIKRIERIERWQRALTLDLLISVSRALALEVRDLVDDPAITHLDPEGCRRRGVCLEAPYAISRGVGLVSHKTHLY